MSEYLSTQKTLEARASALRLEGWIDYDGDGAVNPSALEAGQKYARGEIRDRLKRQLSEDVLSEWDSDTVPESVGAISDDLCIWYFTTTNPALAGITRILYQEAIDKLDEMAAGKRDIYGVEHIEIESNTTRVRYLDCSDADAASGLCDPCAYQYV